MGQSCLQVPGRRPPPEAWPLHPPLARTAQLERPPPAPSSVYLASAGKDVKVVVAEMGLGAAALHRERRMRRRLMVAPATPKPRGLEYLVEVPWASFPTALLHHTLLPLQPSSPMASTPCPPPTMDLVPHSPYSPKAFNSTAFTRSPRVPQMGALGSVNLRLWPQCWAQPDPCPVFSLCRCIPHTILHLSVWGWPACVLPGDHHRPVHL